MNSQRLKKRKRDSQWMEDLLYTRFELMKQHCEESTIELFGKSNSYPIFEKYILQYYLNKDLAE